MAVGLVDRQKLVNIADAVRAKKGITGNMTLDAIASNITSIPTADNNAKYDFTGSGSKSSGDLRKYLTSVDLTGFDTSNYTDMESMFEGYTNLKSIDVSSFDTSKVTSMNRMFYECSSLTSLDVSNFDTSNVTNFWGIFAGCKSIKSLDVSNFNTSKVNNYFSFYQMFETCSSLETIDLSNFDFSNSGNYSIACMFQNCVSLKSVKFPSDVHFNNNVDINSVFYSCTSLETLDLSSFDTTNVTSMSSMFYNCSSLKNLTLGENWASNSSLSSFDLSSCPLTRESAVDVINKLATRDNSPVITFSNKVGLYQSEIDIATNKGWSVSGCSLIVEDATTATVGQFAVIDGVFSKCTYVADTPQSWGQRIFFAVSSFTDSNGNSTFEWGGSGTATGITATAIGTGLSNTNSLIAMNLQSTDGTPTIWDAIKEFRNTHSDRWFIPSLSEFNINPSTDAWSSSEYSNVFSRYIQPNGNTHMNYKNNKYGLNLAIYV